MVAAYHVAHVAAALLFKSFADSIGEGAVTDESVCMQAMYDNLVAQNDAEEHNLFTEVRDTVGIVICTHTERSYMSMGMYVSFSQLQSNN